MSFKIDKYSFEGPSLSLSEIESTSGFFLVNRKARKQALLVDVGESNNIRERHLKIMTEVFLGRN